MVQIYDSSLNAYGATKYGVFGGAPATISALFKEFYLPATRDLLNNKRILTRYMRKNTEDVAGRRAVINLNTARNEGLGHIDEGAYLPDPGRQEYNNAGYDMRYGYGRILFTGPAVSASRSDRGAFLRVMDSEIRGVARDMQVDNNRIMFTDGSGRLAQVDGTTGNVTLVAVVNPGGFTSVGGGTQYLRPGMNVGFVYDSGGGVPALRTDGSGNNGFQLTAVDYSAQTVTLDKTVQGLTGAEWIVRVARKTGLNTFGTSAAATSTYISGGDTAWMNEPFGLHALASDGNPYSGFAGGFPVGGGRLVGEITATGNDWWQAFVLDNLGVPAPFNQDLFQQLADGLDIKSDGLIQMFMTTHGIRRQYANQLVGNKRWAGNTLTLDGGWRALEYDGIPIVVDRDCTRGFIYGLDFGCLMMLMETDYEWMDADGSVLHRLPDNDAYQATLYRYWNNATDARNRLARIEDVQDTV